MSADERIGYSLIAVGLGVVLLWVVLCLMQPWAERTVRAAIEAADATEYPELEEDR